VAYMAGVPPEGGAGSPHELKESKEDERDCIGSGVGYLVGKSTYMPWARSLRREVGRQSLSGGCAYLYSSENLRQLRLDPRIWTRKYANKDANAREDIIYKITKPSVSTTNKLSKRGRRGPPPL
jgi:hypothetical protein